MIPGFDLIQFAQTAGPVAALVVVLAIIFAENGLLIGFFFPGDSILFTTGILIQGTKIVKLDFNINFIIFLLFIAATLGSTVGYFFGRKIGPSLFKRPNSLLFKQENVKKAQDFYEKHGGGAIILARFVPIVRTFAPLLAGVANMEYRLFMLFNLVGGAIWIASVTYGGYFMGAWLNSIGVDVDSVILPIVALILLASVAPAAYQTFKDKNRRKAVLTTFKLQFKRIVTRKEK